MAVDQQEQTELQQWSQEKSYSQSDRSYFDTQARQTPPEGRQIAFRF